jgi:hypothetical protein
MENLKALVYNRKLTDYQRALAQREFEGLIERLELYEKAVKNNAVLPHVNARFPEKEDLESECTAYMDSVIKETDYSDRPIHLKYAFKAGVNYLNEILNGR